MRYLLYSIKFSSPFRRWLIVFVSLTLLTIGCADDGTGEPDDTADDTDETSDSDTKSGDAPLRDTNSEETDTTDTGENDTGIPVDRDSQPNCQIGQEGCPCTGGGACDPGLTCFSKLCVNAGGDSDTTWTDTDTLTDTESVRTETDTQTGTNNSRTDTDTLTDTESSRTDTDTQADTESALTDTNSATMDTDSVLNDTDSVLNDTGTSEDSESGADTTPVVICTAETARCTGGDVQTCNVSGTGWEVTDSCTADEACNTENINCLPLMLTPDSGWVHRDTNGLGIQGAWYVYGESFDSPVPGDVWEAENDGRMCMRGTAGNDNSARPTAEFQLCQTDGEQTPAETLYGIGECPFGDLSGIKGFRVTIGGSIVPSGLRVMFMEPGREQNAFVEVGSGSTSAYFSSARNLGGTPIYNTAEIDRVGFQVQNNDDFDFCIFNVTPIR